MWNAIAKAIESEMSLTFNIEHKVQVTGGDINVSYVISGNKQKYFIKINDKAQISIFEAEAYSLKLIRQNEQVACPNVITTGIVDDNAFLILNCFEFVEPNETQWLLFGQQLANLHKTTIHGQFGWQTDNVIGTTLQPNQWHSNWRQFFSEQRIGWQLQLLRENSIKLGNIDHIVQVCHDLLLHHHVKPCLVHGDLWQGNVGFTREQPIIFDPASYYGDREVDIAMTELFGRFPEEFYRGYQQTFPLPDAYEIRKQVYNFYHILNHANLFGGVYIDQSKACLQRLLSFH